MTSQLKKQIRIVVVDDSAFMRKAISMMLESDPDVKVIGTARDGEEGVAIVKRLKPDLVTMDVEMPRMDGLTALRQIMESNPVPVMMVSSITTDGAQATLEALELGAVDFIPKQMSYVSLDIVKIREELLAKIKNIVARKHILMARYRQQSAFAKAATGKIRRSPAIIRPPTSGRRPARFGQIKIIAIGSSTGGPPALQAVIPALPANLPVPVVIAQHMPPMFTKSLAERLNGMSALTVREAENGDLLEPGQVLIAPGGKHLTIQKEGPRYCAVISTEPAATLYKPCVDVLLKSVAKIHGSRTLGVILTGMGSNGVAGSRVIKSKGGVLIAQDESTSVVYGMPRAVAEAELTDRVVKIDGMAAEIASYF